ncbi:ABC transporter permease [Endozoicomonas lisbonensis]|uniref:Transport permease protein n=1 Tax=Endozoicomonas lisbonensis TaxID=3120522 RepID=A0ABV2SH20_9GAMM
MEKRSSLQIQLAVIYALSARELKTRFGRYRLGLIWAILGPLLQILIFFGLFYFRGRSTVGGLELPVFLATGIAPFFYFRKLINQCMGAVTGNRNLLSYRQVRIFDLFLTRLILEANISFIVLITLIAGSWWIGFEVEVVNSLRFLLVYLVFSFFSFGIGLIFGVLNTLYPEPSKLLPMTLRPLMFVSGTFFSINEVPRGFQEMLLWNPLIHAFELMRSSFSYHYDISLVSLEYLTLSAIVSVTLGMLMLRANWRSMLTI